MALFREDLASAVASLVDGEVRANAPLALWTSVRVGGPAEVWVRPDSVDGLCELLRRQRQEGWSLTLLGGGANTLVGDGGVPGILLKLPSDLFEEEVESGPDDARITLGAGAPIARLIQRMRAEQRVGAEFLAGIPGTIGGAVSMNAGTKHGECMSVVEAVELATADGIGWISKEDLVFSYRHTQIPAGAVVTRARFRLPSGDLARSKATMDADLAYRKGTQPLSQPNFGSVFQNPPGDHAGRLIEAVGLKGHTIGRAQISTKHANWIVNLGGASAADIVALMELTQRRVGSELGVTLVPEVKRVGLFVPGGDGDDGIQSS